MDLLKKNNVLQRSGKEVSKYNATKHGLLSRQMNIKGESKKQLDELTARLMKSLVPQNDVEGLLVEKVVADTWRLKRALRIEKEMIEEHMEPDDIFGNKTQKSMGTVFSMDFANYDTYGKLVRYISSIERGIYRALHELQRLQASRKGELVSPPVIIDVEMGQHD